MSLKYNVYKNCQVYRNIDLLGTTGLSILWVTH